MSQDTETCAKCGDRCGYDDNKGYWDEPNKAICSRCKRNLIYRFCAFFGIEGICSTEMGLEVEWNDVDRILDNIQRDPARRVSYLVTDKEFYEREIRLPTRVEDDILAPLG